MQEEPRSTQWSRIRHVAKWRRSRDASGNPNQRGSAADNDALDSLSFSFLRVHYPDYRTLTDEDIRQHWQSVGLREHRLRNWQEAVAQRTHAGLPLPERFDEAHYIQQNQDLQEQFSEPGAGAWHFLMQGHRENRTFRREVMTMEHSHLRTYRVFDPIDVTTDPEAPERINILFPATDVVTMSAGFFGVFRLADWLRQLGYRVRLVFFENFALFLEDLKESLGQHEGLENLLDRVEVTYVGERRSPLVVSPRDRVVATVWYSAYLAQHIHHLLGQGPFLYLIQDDESRFHGAGSASVLADATYAMDFYALVSSHSLLDHFTTQKSGTLSRDPSRGQPFQNAASPALGDRRVRQATARRRLAYYSRPTVDRNAFDIGIEALRRCCRSGILDSSWDLIGLGIGDMDVEIVPGRWMTQLPRMGLADYRKALTEFDLALSLMISPHPSLVPMDFAGSGVPVVTNVYGTKTFDYLRDLSPLIHPSGLEPDDIVDAIARVVDTAAAADSGGTGLRWPTDWADVFAPEHEKIARAALGEPTGQPRPSGLQGMSHG